MLSLLQRSAAVLTKFVANVRFTVLLSSWLQLNTRAYQDCMLGGLIAGYEMLQRDCSEVDLRLQGQLC